MREPYLFTLIGNCIQYGNMEVNKGYTAKIVKRVASRKGDKGGGVICVGTAVLSFKLVSTN